jgi:hypothetical protein
MLGNAIDNIKDKIHSYGTNKRTYQSYGSSIGPKWPEVGHRGRIYEPEPNIEPTGLRNRAQKKRF